MRSKAGWRTGRAGTCALAWLLASCQGAGGGPQPPAGGGGPSAWYASSLTKDGVTWTFSQPVPVGQFVNGDYYVVGPVTISAISPAPAATAPYQNGSALNLPTPSGKSGFDSRLNDGADQSWWFDPAARVYPPMTLGPGDSLVSSRSVAVPHSLPAPMRAGDSSISPVASMSVLTVLGSAVAPDAFRPSYCDRGQKIHFGSALRRSLLPSLHGPSTAGIPALSDFEALFRRPWVDLSPFNFDAPAEYMAQYGREVAMAVSYASLLLMLDFPPEQKANLTNYLVQYGIDLYGCLQAGHGWPAFGGHRSGRKLPIVLAGLLLGDADMQRVSDAFPDRFGEDMQTMYVSQTPPAGSYRVAWQGATAVYAGHYGVRSDGQPGGSGVYGPYEHLRPADWPGQLGEEYRRCCTSVAWVGEALAMRILGAESLWSHQAFFDYVDRWMFEDDTQAVADIKAQTGSDYGVGWARQRQTRRFLQGEVPYPGFIDDMWGAFRPAP
jgi:hypothetical protein